MADVIWGERQRRRGIKGDPPVCAEVLLSYAGPKVFVRAGWGRYGAFAPAALGGGDTERLDVYKRQIRYGKRGMRRKDMIFRR